MALLKRTKRSGTSRLRLFGQVGRATMRIPVLGTLLRVIGKVLTWLRIPRYFGDAFREVRKVIWPTRRQSLRLTFAVILFTAIFTILTAILDFGFNKAVERIFL